MNKKEIQEIVDKHDKAVGRARRVIVDPSEESKPVNLTAKECRMITKALYVAADKNEEGRASTEPLDHKTWKLRTLAANLRRVHEDP